MSSPLHLVYSPTKQLLSTSTVPGTVPGSEDILWTKHSKVPAPWSLHSSRGDRWTLSTWYHGVQNGLEVSCLKSVYCLSSLADNNHVKGEATNEPQQFHWSRLHHLSAGWTQVSPSTNLGLSFWGEAGLSDLFFMRRGGPFKLFFFMVLGEHFAQN